MSDIHLDDIEISCLFKYARYPKSWGHGYKPPPSFGAFSSRITQSLVERGLLTPSGDGFITTARGIRALPASMRPE